jgi:hypothetical protein
MARTAVVAGTASATANAVNRRAHDRSVEQQQAAAYRASESTAPPAEAQPPEVAAPTSQPDDLVGRLTELAKLRDAGVLSAAEFDAAKAKLLA